MQSGIKNTQVRKKGTEWTRRETFGGGGGQTHMFLCWDLDGCLGSSGLVSCLERSGLISVLVLISVRFFLQCVSLQ